jgi:hypothetical protein
MYAILSPPGDNIGIGLGQLVSLVNAVGGLVGSEVREEIGSDHDETSCGCRFRDHVIDTPRSLK